MSQRYLGGIITASPTTPTLSSASGVWTLEQQLQYYNTWSPQLISRSVRLRSSASAYFNRTPASAGNRKTWTWSAWVKRGVLGSDQYIFNAGPFNSGNDFEGFYFMSNDTLRVQLTISNSQIADYRTNAVYRDVSSWYHFVIQRNGQAYTVWVNGVSQTFGTSSFVSNPDGYISSANAHRISSRLDNLQYLDGYLTEINFIDGQALTPSSFGAFDYTGIWQPLPYTGTYGTNGFYLNFSDNSSNTATTIGKDYSGNGNNWTPNNISVTAGVTYDSMLDVPTPYADGGNGRGNYCTLNPTAQGVTALANGNLQFNYNATYSAPGTIGVTSGKWYFEGLLSAQVTSEQVIGVVNGSWQNSVGIGADANGWGIIVQSNANNGQAYHNATVTSSYTTFANNDIAMVAFDVDAGKIWFGKNGTWFNSGAPASGTGQIYSNLSGTIFPGFDNRSNSGGVLYANFGQRPFTYTPPSGFVALNTQNLPTPTISNGATVMAASTYTGTGSSLTIANSGNNAGSISFQPDLVWVKGRSGATDHAWYDSVRGVQKQLESNTTTAETTETTGLTAFGSTGFTVGALAQMNTSTATYVAWQWQAGQGSTSSNTSGSITSTVSVNATAGFSVVTASASGTSPVTMGHGLGVAPSFIIGRVRNNTANWYVYSSSFLSQDYLVLNTTAAKATSSNIWDSAPTSTVFTVGNPQNGWNGGTVGSYNYVFYCWAAVKGFSAFGSYTGNGSADGPFVYCGFRPRWILIKRTVTAGANWYIHDTSRDTYNVSTKNLNPDSSGAENTIAYADMDIVSNGFKLRNSSAETNGSYDYIYAAFAENPFKTSRAR